MLIYLPKITDLVNSIARILNPRLSFITSITTLYMQDLSQLTDYDCYYSVNSLSPPVCVKNVSLIEIECLAPIHRWQSMVLELEPRLSVPRPLYHNMLTHTC